MSLWDWVKKEAKMPGREAQWAWDVARGKTSLRDAFGEHNRIHADATRELGDNVFTRNPDATAAAVAAAFMAPAALGGGQAASGGAGGAAGAASEVGAGSAGGEAGAFTATDAVKPSSSWARYVPRGGTSLPAPQRQPIDLEQESVQFTPVDYAEYPYAYSSKRLKQAPRTSMREVMARGAAGADPIDQNGVQMAAIQALTKKITDVHSRIQKLKGQA